MYLLLGHWGPYLNDLPVLEGKKRVVTSITKTNKKIPTDSM